MAAEKTMAASKSRPRTVPKVVPSAVRIAALQKVSPSKAGSAASPAIRRPTRTSIGSSMVTKRPRRIFGAKKRPPRTSESA